MRLRYLKFKRDPQRHGYMDLALTPVNDEETATRELFQSDAAQAFVRKEQRLERIKQGQAA